MKGAFEAFIHYPFEGTHSKLSEEQKQDLTEELQQGNGQTPAEAKAYIEEHFGITYTEWVVCVTCSSKCTLKRKSIALPVCAEGYGGGCRAV
jgi:transposase